MPSRMRASYIARVDDCLDQLSCRVCMERFDHDRRRPLSLPCGHTLCRLCCSSLREDHCPLDRCPIINRAQLPPNYELERLLEAVARLRAGSSTTSASSRSPLPAAARDAQYIPEERVKLLQLLGSGTAGDVYTAELRGREGLVAVKVFKVQLQSPTSSSSLVAPTDILMRSFMREVEVLMAVANRTQRCVSLIGCSVYNGSPCIIMKLYPKGHLRVPPCGFSLREALEWGLSIAQALKEVHALSVVVADLKPANILVDDNQQAVLTDFNLSRRLTTNLAAGHGNSLFGGTANYMAPEQSRAGPLSTKADSWAWACVMMELLTGQPPWDDMPDMNVYRMLVKGRISPQPPAGIPAGLARLLQQCWNIKSPAERPSAEEIVARLEGNMAVWTACPMPPTTPPQRHSSSDRARRSQSAPAAAERPTRPGFFGRLERLFGRSGSETAAAARSNSQQQQQRQRSYEGRTMSDWVAQLCSDSPIRQQEAAEALARFTNGPDGTATKDILQANGITALVAVLTGTNSDESPGFIGRLSSGRSRSSTVEACRWAAATLANMLYDDKGCALDILCQDAVPPLMLLMHSLDELSARFAVHALKRLAAAGDVSRDALAQLELVQPAVELLLCSGDKLTRVQAAYLLRELCQSGPSVQQEVKQAGIYSGSGDVALEHKLWSLAVSAGDADLQQAVGSLLGVLQTGL